jgi:hypothetical protein
MTDAVGIFIMVVAVIASLASCIGCLHFGYVCGVRGAASRLVALAGALECSTKQTEK